MNGECGADAGRCTGDDGPWAVNAIKIGNADHGRRKRELRRRMDGLMECNIEERFQADTFQCMPTKMSMLCEMQDKQGFSKIYLMDSYCNGTNILMCTLSNV